MEDSYQAGGPFLVSPTNDVRFYNRQVKNLELVEKKRRRMPYEVLSALEGFY